MLRLAYGRIADDLEVLHMVSNWRAIRLEAERLQEQRRAESSGATMSDAPSLDYAQGKQVLDAWLRVEMDTLTEATRAALLRSDADWFRRVAAVIDAADIPTDTYSFHARVALRLGRLKLEVRNGVPHYRTDAPLDQTARYTIAEACELLERDGFRPPQMTDEDWAGKVRDACDKQGIRLKRSRPGPKPRTK
jgi:hypothetical protein